MRLPDESISFQNTTGDSGIENLYVYGKLNYNFENDDITVKSINVTSPSIFSGDVAFSGNVTGIESFVQGMIIMWNSTVASIPTGFVLCDGNNGTPDLRGRFIVGHHPSNGDYDVNDTGGAETVTLTVNQIPSHKHVTTFDGHKFFPGDGSTSIGYGGAGGYPATVFNMDNTGGGQSHENRPPYYALCYIMKT